MSTGRFRPSKWTNDAAISAVGISGQERVSADSAPPRHRCVRICGLVAAIACGVLVVPATARSDPFSTDQALQQADAAVTDAQTLASQQLTASSAAVSAALTETPAPIPTSAASVEAEASKAVSEAIAAAGTASATSPAVPAPTAPKPASRPVSPPHRHRGTARARPKAARGPAPWSERAVGGTKSVRAIGTGLSTAPPQAEARGHGSAARDRRADGAPRRLPPLPVPPQGLSGTPEGMGSGTPPLLLVAALAAGLLIIFFESPSRLLLRSAFRKPRRLALPPWHPG